MFYIIFALCFVYIWPTFSKWFPFHLRLKLRENIHPKWLWYRFRNQKQTTCFDRKWLKNALKYRLNSSWMLCVLWITCKDYEILYANGWKIVLTWCSRYTCRLVRCISGLFYRFSTFDLFAYCRRYFQHKRTKNKTNKTNKT